MSLSKCTTWQVVVVVDIFYAACAALSTILLLEFTHTQIAHAHTHVSRISADMQHACLPVGSGTLSLNVGGA